MNNDVNNNNNEVKPGCRQ